MDRKLLVDDEMLDRIIINELKDVYSSNQVPEKIDCSDDYIEPDTQLLYGIDKVLKYFMSPNEYDQWVIERNKND